MELKTNIINEVSVEDIGKALANADTSEVAKVLRVWGEEVEKGTVYLDPNTYAHKVANSMIVDPQSSLVEKISDFLRARRLGL